MLSFFINSLVFNSENGVFNFAASSYANDKTPFFQLTKQGSSTVTKFEAVLIDNSGIELGRTALNTAFILVDNAFNLFYCLSTNSISLCANSLYYFYIETSDGTFYASNFFLTFETKPFVKTEYVSAGGALGVQTVEPFKLDKSLANLGTKALEYTQTANFAFLGNAIETVTSFEAVLIDQNYNILDSILLENSYLTKDSNNIFTVSTNILPVPLCLNSLYYYKIVTSVTTYFSEIFLAYDLAKYDTDYLFLVDDTYFLDIGNGHLFAYK